MFQRISIAAALMCGLASCSPPAQQGEGSASAPSAANAASGIQPGQYRTTVTMLEMNIPGVSSQNVNMAPTTTNECVTSTDIAELTRGSLVEADEGETCTQNAMNTAGGHIQGDATCSGENGTRTMHMTGSYNATHVEMEVNATTDMPSGAGQMSQRMRIVTDRIGDCPAGANAD